MTNVLSYRVFRSESDNQKYSVRTVDVDENPYGDPILDNATFEDAVDLYNEIYGLNEDSN